MLAATDNVRRGMIAPANPAWLFDKEGASVAFNWGRHNTIADGKTLGLRLFVVADAPGQTQWQVEWRWVTSVEKMAGPHLPVTSLGTLVASDPPNLAITHPGLVGGELQLNASEFFKLSPDGENPAGEYLMVKITLVKREAQAGRVGLLLVELVW